MQALQSFVDGIGIIGPGMRHWQDAERCLTDPALYQAQRTIYPTADLLPINERRRASNVVELALALGMQAMDSAAIAMEDVITVFASSAGDAANCSSICETLASNDRMLSPTRFHNSVTNVSAGYWSIATSNMASSSMICAYDASFGAGFLEAIGHVHTRHKPCLLIAYDINYPPPIYATRPIPDGFGIALLLSHDQTPRSIVKLDMSLTQDPPQKMQADCFEYLRCNIPAARGLLLLDAIAQKRHQRRVLEYLEHLSLAFNITPTN